MRAGTVPAPVSKSHLHRLLIADFLAGDRARLRDEPDDSADIAATKHCLRALAEETAAPILDCGESGSTLRFLAPVAAALGKRPVFRKAGRLASRPMIDYPELKPGTFELKGDVSSQFVTGLLFALPLLAGDSAIRFTTPLESRGYVDLTLEVLKGAGIAVRARADGFNIPGGQTYRAQPLVRAEGDWSGAAFWLAMNALGSTVEVTGLNGDSAQPDRKVVGLLSQLTRRAAASPGLGTDPDVAECPDLFPVLSVVAAAQPGRTVFTGTRRLRLKESDRVAAMADVLGRLGRKTAAGENTFTVFGSAEPFPGGGEFTAFGDHRIAMSVAVAATFAKGPLFLDDVRCADKSYPGFFDLFEGFQGSVPTISPRFRGSVPTISGVCPHDFGGLSPRFRGVCPHGFGGLSPRYRGVCPHDFGGLSPE